MISLRGWDDIPERMGHVPTPARHRGFTLPRPTVSADALLLARLPQARVAEKRLLALLPREPADAQQFTVALAGKGAHGREISWSGLRRARIRRPCA